ncbi:MAG: SseB family protein [Candidatus Nanopelagicales bacterium]|nr:SseB family protein [Candidatus Nanopelagicales bacterium]
MAPDSLGRGRHLATPQFAGDEGSADLALREAIAAGPQLLDDGLARDLVLELLMDSRLLVAVVAVLDAVDEHGGDKDSHMTVVSMISPGGERGLLAFTGVDSMASWDPAARPVPVTGPDAARAALESEATAIVIDVMGPARHVVTGERLAFLAQGQPAGA